MVCIVAPPVAALEVCEVYGEGRSEIVRTGPNTLYSNSYTRVTGAYSPNWSTHVATTTYRAGSSIHSASDSQSGGAQSTVRYDVSSIESVGVGLYQASSYHQWTPNAYCRSEGATAWSGWTSDSMTIERPIITRSDPAALFLGNGIIVSGSRSSEVTISVAAAKGATGDPSFSVAESPGSGYGAVFCPSGSTCSQATYRALKASTGCDTYNVHVYASFGGLKSEPLYIFNNSPASFEVFYYTHSTPGAGGWRSNQMYKVLDMCGGVLDWVIVKESFNNSTRKPGSNWDLTLDPGQWMSRTAGSGCLDGQFNTYAEFCDIMFETQVQTPNPVSPGSNGFSEAVADTITCHEQDWWTSQITSGVKVQSNLQYHYLDHGKHVGGSSCPSL